MSDWINRRKKDQYYRKAKQEKFRSRAIYKLVQLNQKYRFLNNASVIIDVCCAPGSWIQAIQSIIGKDVYILGIDINNVRPIKGNVKLLKADITSPEISKKIQSLIPRKVDLVLSDCSMKTSGTSSLDVERQNYLVECTFNNITKQFLKMNGHFISKVFQGPSINNIKREFQKHFKFTKFTKPKASISKSREMYLICKYYCNKRSENDI
ncbi:MAG: SAM-dependent methyltransferase [Candidatus Helarchaeota archaeon]